MVNEKLNNGQTNVENPITLNLCRICLEDGAVIPIFESDSDNYKDILGKLNLCFGDEIPDINGYPRNICETCHNTVNETFIFINKYKESCKKMKEVLEFVNYSNEEGKDFNYVEPEIQIIQISGSCLTDASTQYEVPVARKKRKPDAENKRIACNKHIKKSYSSTRTRNNKKQKFGEANINPLKNDTILESNNVTKLETNIATTAEIHTDNMAVTSSGTKEDKNVEMQKKTQQRTLRQPKPRKKKKKEPTSEEPTCCEYCGKEYTNRSLLSRHIIINHDVERPHQCTHCPKAFTTSELLKRHIRRVHSEEKNCVCSECGKAFVGLSELGSHYKSSHIKKPCPKIYPCKFCGKLYTTTKSAIMHERSVHTGERPAACNICDAKFTHDDYLKLHMRLHTGETPYKCPVCAKGFSQSGNMKSHIRHNHSISQLGPEILKSMNPKYLKYMKP